jgi:hypothetical protein
MKLKLVLNYLAKGIETITHEIYTKLLLRW